eukprot:CAMPEP_0172208854 /NCGR_PEP_ID=MMETSP1050-20130122/34745_1 /TAXON_ID=233186 /ORGANISM="Cryptomonas curvata, Strain CCAP979/52" /LENGTH=368 /DNA_ID=CAMNT_0012888575 /DNA_START=232 /DNA_END=1338 /DNA_ORIENTATION=-
MLLEKGTRIRYAVDGIRGGPLGRAERRTVIQDEINRVKDLPGPHSYLVRQEDSTPSHGGRMMGCYSSAPPYTITWRVEQIRRENSPSPNTYCQDLSDPLRLSGGRISSSKLRRDKWLASTVESPGPAAYDSVLQNAKRVTGGLISNARCKSELDWHLLKAAKSPAPGDYGCAAVAATRLASVGTSRRDVCDPVPKCDGPGPGSYELCRNLPRGGVRIAPRPSRGKGRTTDEPARAPGESGYLRCTCGELTSWVVLECAGPGAYHVETHSISHRLAQPDPIPKNHLPQRSGPRPPGTLDPVVYSDKRGRWSLSGDWRALQALAQGWVASSRTVQQYLDTLGRHRDSDSDSAVPAETEATTSKIGTEQSL